MRNRNFTPVMIRLRLQTLRPASTKCSWKRRTSSAVAVSGERFKNAANRLQLLMWLRCEWGPSLRAVVSLYGDRTLPRSGYRRSDLVP